MARLKDKVALVTGGASGIGEGTVRKFVEEGARCVVVDLQIERAQSLVEELGDACFAFAADVASEEGVAGAVDFSVEKFGKLDIVFNNAGILGSVGPIKDISSEGWHRTIDVLLSSVFFGIKHATRVMEGNGGVIINTASTARPILLC